MENSLDIKNLVMLSGSVPQSWIYIDINLKVLTKGEHQDCSIDVSV
jgi:hypothetical protein